MYGMNTQSGTRFNYTCNGTGHTVSVSGPRADETVMAVVVGRLARTDFEGLAVEVASDGRQFEQQDRLDEIPDQIAELMDAYRSGQLSGGIVFAQVGKLEAEKGELEAQRDRELDQALTGRMAVAVSADDFDGLDVTRQRSVIEAVLTAVTVAPSRKGQPWTPDRLTYAWRMSR